MQNSSESSGSVDDSGFPYKKLMKQMNEVSQDSSSPTEENYNRSNESMYKKES